MALCIAAGGASLVAALPATVCQTIVIMQKAVYEGNATISEVLVVRLDYEAWFEQLALIVSPACCTASIDAMECGDRGSLKPTRRAMFMLLYECRGL